MRSKHDRGLLVGDVEIGCSPIRTFLPASRGRAEEKAGVFP